MNTSNDKSKQPKDTTEKSALTSKTKVSSYTQVEPEFVRTEFRSIVGQEDIENYPSKRLHDTNLRKQTKGVRPPLVGQASSSSNDSVSLSFERRVSDTENVETTASFQSGVLDSYVDGNTETCGSSFNRGTPYLLNRDDYINQRPPEGSSEQAGIVVQPVENVQEFPKIRSPSSASSVTSSRPLEWDSLADVGYNQHYPVGKPTDSRMDSLERIALVYGTNLLTRSDPEGTTGPIGQSQPIIPIYKNSVHSVIRSKSKLGYPNAESTPMATCPTSDVSPETASDDISPIAREDHNKFTEVEKNSLHDSSFEDASKKFKPIDGSDIQRLSPTAQSISRSKIPLFPEIECSLPHTPTHDVLKNDLDHIKPVSNEQSNNKTNSIEGPFRPISDKSENSIVSVEQQKLVEPTTGRGITQNFKSQLESKLLLLQEGTSAPTSIALSKKISSSLENISIGSRNSDLKNNKSLPRSLSQSSLQADNLSPTSINVSSGRKYNMAVHNIIQYNKSASSSSIATVVHRKGDSPKHLFAQTSASKLESVSIQVGEDDVKHKPSNVPKFSFTNTPHLPKTVLLQKMNNRSNYFNYSSNEEMQEQDSKYNSKNLVTSEFKNDHNLKPTHCHSGAVCTGAHKKVLSQNYPTVDNLLNQNHFDLCQSRETLNPTFHSDTRQPLLCGQELSRNTNNNKMTSGTGTNTGTGTLESIESSTKSNGGWTDKQCSMAVEDRVNSFEYLPGHVYENAERQQPVDSRDTSSMSIQNQVNSIKNEMAEGSKLWCNSGSASSTLERDIRKGVEIFSDFIKGSCANDSILKKKLIGQVVERLTTKTYSQDLKNPENLASNVPWVPSRHCNPLERSGRETRRSINRSKVPCEFSSRSEKSGSTNASSDCFIPRPAANSTFLPSSLRDNSAVAAQNTHSSTSEISIEKSSKNHGRPPQPLDVKTHIIENGRLTPSKNDTDFSSSKSGSNWKEPVTKSEKMLEEKKSKYRNRPTSRNQSDEMSLVHYLNMERENQLFWIRSEIQHLSNLKALLEKQENLKQHMKGFQSRHGKSTVDVLKDRNNDRLDGIKTETKSTHTPHMQRKPSLKGQNKFQPTLSAWLERTLLDSTATTPVQSAVSSDNGMEDWTSHHYKNEIDERLRSCMKRKNKLKHTNEGRRSSLLERKSRALYDEPPLTSHSQKPEEKNFVKPPLTPYHSRKEKQVDESVFITEKGIAKRNAQTETLTTVGVQTTDSMQQLPVVHPNWFKHAHSHRKAEQHCRCACMCKKGCQHNCCCNNVKNNKNFEEEEKPKSPVGYYITFEHSPRGREKSDCNTDQRLLEEVKIQVPVSEPKLRPTKRPKSRVEIREKENIPFREENKQTGSEERGSNSRGSGSESSYSQSCSTRDQNRPQSGRPIYSGGTGSLQYYLLRNRPSYVSRAEDRRQCIAQMQYLRELRDQSKRRLLTLTEPQALAELPPPPLNVRRVFSQQTMRRQTEKKYRQLAEVQGRQQDTKRKEGYRTNRLMAEIFKKKLQKRVLKGEVNLSNSVSVISSL